MKTNAVAIVLVVACLGLGTALLVESKKHTDEKQKQDDAIAVKSNEVVTLESKVGELRVVNATLETNLAASRDETSNRIAEIKEIRSNLDATNAALDKIVADAKAASAAAEAEKAEQDKKIAELEGQNQELDKQSLDLRSSITNLETQIQSTQKKLAASEGDRTLLLKELARLQAEKADLEKKFNDLAVLKEQVSKLKEELSISRRLDWIRRGIYDTFNQKGGERLIHPVVPLPPSTNANLTVELREDGGVKVETSGGTNSPVPK